MVSMSKVETWTRSASILIQRKVVEPRKETKSKKPMEKSNQKDKMEQERITSAKKNKQN